MGLAKTKSTAKQIDSQGKQLFESVLPKDSGGISAEYVAQDGTNDYGIDGELQVFKGRRYDDKTYKIQLKSTDSPKFIKSGSQITFSIDVNSLDQYINRVNVPLSIILADVKNQKVYWHATQTDDNLARGLAQSIAARRKSITIYFDTTQELRKGNFEDLLDYFHEAESRIVKKLHLDNLQKSPITSAIDEYRNEFKLDGFDILSRRSNDPIRGGTVMSFGNGNMWTDFVTNENYRPELAIRLK